MEKSNATKSTSFLASVLLLSPFAYGLCIPTVSILSSEIKKTYTSGTGEMCKMLTSLLYLGAFISNVGNFYLRMGYIELLLLGNLLVLGSSLLLLKTHYLCFYVSRFIAGIAFGISAGTVPYCLSQIAPPGRRGLVTSLYGASIISGIIVGCAICHAELTIIAFSWILTFLVAAQLALLPLWVGKSLFMQKAQASGSFTSFLSSPKAFKSLFLTAIYHVGQHTTGMGHLLQDPLSIFPGNHAMKTLGYLCVLALCISLVSSHLTDYFGRKPLTISSCITLIICCAALYQGFYSVTFSILFIVGYNLAIANVPFILIGEMFPKEDAIYGALYATSFNWFGAFISIYMIRGSNLKYNISFLMYIGYLVFLLASYLFLYRETRGKVPGYQ